jgi:hypothetical protein
MGRRDPTDKPREEPAQLDLACAEAHGVVYIDAKPMMRSKNT